MVPVVLMSGLKEFKHIPLHKVEFECSVPPPLNLHSICHLEKMLSLNSVNSNRPLACMPTDVFSLSINSHNDNKHHALYIIVRHILECLSPPQLWGKKSKSSRKQATNEKSTNLGYKLAILLHYPACLDVSTTYLNL